MPLGIESVKQILATLKNKDGKFLSEMVNEKGEKVIDLILAEQTKNLAENKASLEEAKKKGISADQVALKEEFVGKIAVKMGAITDDDLKIGLREQAKEFSRNAVNDIKVIAENGTQKTETMKVNGKEVVKSEPYYNLKTGEHKEPENVALDMANVARNIVSSANKTGKVTKEMQESVEAAAVLSDIFSDPVRAAEFPKDDLIALRDKALKGLKDASVAAKDGPKDVKLDDYIAKLSASIEDGYKENKIAMATSGLKDKVQLASAEDRPTNVPHKPRDIGAKDTSYDLSA